MYWRGVVLSLAAASLVGCASERTGADSATAALFPGESKREFTTISGHTYFFLARPSDRAKTLSAMSAAGGVAGLLVASAVTSNNGNPGPLDFFPLEEAAARAMIAELRLAE
jgi:hypothetical protein